MGQRVLLQMPLCSAIIWPSRNMIFVNYMGKSMRIMLEVLKAYCKAGWIIEGVIEGRYLTPNGPMDQLLVSCNNPAYLHSEQTKYNVEKLSEWIAFREEFTKK
jgi:hypothetical protein